MWLEMNSMTHRSSLTIKHFDLDMDAILKNGGVKWEFELIEL